MQRRKNLPVKSPAPWATLDLSAADLPPLPFWRRHLAISVITLAAAALILPNLGGTYLWADEGDTAILARSILVNGVPRAWDGVTFTESDTGKRLNASLLQVVHPWVPYYLAAASIGMLGDTSLAARLPFALAGIATVPWVYALMRRYGSDRRTACLAALLLVLSVQFLLYARQSRHYALNMLLTCILVYLMPALATLRGRVAFGAVAVLLFHCHPLPALAVLATAGLLTIAWPAMRPLRRGFFWTLPVVLPLTLPWLALGPAGLEENSELPVDLTDLVYRAWQFAAEAFELVPWVLWLLAGPWVIWRASSQVRGLVLVVATTMGALWGLNVMSQATYDTYMLGIRYACAWIPLGACLTAVVIEGLARGRLWIATPLVALCTLTHLPDHTLLWLPADDAKLAFGQYGILMHVPPWQADLPVWQQGQIVRREMLAYLPELWEDNPGTVAAAADYLKEHARPGDRVITNFETEPLYFHTGLPQAYKVLPKYPCYKAVQAAGLPAYVTTVEGARWVVWRHKWVDYNGLEWKTLLAELQRQGAHVERVAEVPETSWENRENIHWRRFPTEGHLYYVLHGIKQWTVTTTPEADWPKATIYRVDWPTPAAKS